VPKKKKIYLQKLADELIELRCGAHSVGNVYGWLLKAYGDANRAKADFIRFLSGTLPTRLLETASEWIADEQGYETEAGNYEGHSVAIRGSIVIPDPLKPMPSHG
jgi:hypothetical protein